MDVSLYVITDRSIGRGRSHEEIARLAIAGGATAVQLRDKECGREELVRTGTAIARIAKEAGALFIVNDSPEIALACGADGVHLGQDDMPVAEARRILSRPLLIGVSVCTAGQAAKAEADGADYLAASPVFPTGSKPDAKGFCGIEGIRGIRAASRLPLVAIGGITRENACDAIRAGADGIAVISAVVAQPDIAAAARGLKSVVRSALLKR
jgi:thiamine-phosphate pyrophosphorylase